MNKILAFNPPVAWIKETIEKAGTTIGSVHFTKRGDGELRKMSYRLHVRKPSTAKTPKGIVKDTTSVFSSPSISSTGNVMKLKWDKRAIDKAHKQMTVLDANKVVRDKAGNKIGRGDWRTVPLERVIRISNKGITYLIERD